MTTQYAEQIRNAIEGMEGYEPGAIYTARIVETGAGEVIRVADRRHPNQIMAEVSLTTLPAIDVFDPSSDPYLRIRLRDVLDRVAH